MLDTILSIQPRV